MSKGSSSLAQLALKAFERKTYEIAIVAPTAALIWLFFTPASTICMKELCTAAYTCLGGCETYSVISHVINYGNWPWHPSISHIYWILPLIGVSVYGVWSVIGHYMRRYVQGRNVC